MKQGIHPDYHIITVVMTDGSKYETYSTYGKEGDTLQLDVDPKTHPAWIGGTNVLNQRANQVAKFSNRFGNLGTKASADAAAAQANAPVVVEAPKSAEAKPAAKAAPAKKGKK